MNFKFFTRIGLVTFGLVAWAALSVPYVRASVKNTSGEIPSGDTIWNQLNQIVGQASSSDFPQVEKGHSWIEGEALKYMLGPSVQKFGKILDPIFHDLIGVELAPGNNSLQLNTYLLHDHELQIKEPANTKAFQLYGVHLPENVQLLITHEGSVIRITPMEVLDGDSLFLEVAIPIVSGRVYVRSISFDVETGLVNVEAGVLGNTITLVAEAQIFSTPIKAQFDLWKTIEANLSGLTDAPFIFRTF